MGREDVLTQGQFPDDPKSVSTFSLPLNCLESILDFVCNYPDRAFGRYMSPN